MSRGQQQKRKRHEQVLTLQVVGSLADARGCAVTVQQDFEWFHGACQQTGTSREGPRKLLSMVDADMMVTVLQHVVAGMKCTSSIVWQ